MEKKKLKKLVLNKNVVFSLSHKEEVKIRGGQYTNETLTGNTCIANTCQGISCGLGCTYGCGTLIVDGCGPGYS
jgi:putative aminopeptidase FrvX